MVMVDLACVKVSAASSPVEISLHCAAVILGWDDQTETWTEVGMMETWRINHAMVALPTDADTFCSDVNN